MTATQRLTPPEHYLTHLDCRNYPNRYITRRSSTAFPSHDAPQRTYPFHPRLPHQTLRRHNVTFHSKTAIHRRSTSLLAVTCLDCPAGPLLAPTKLDEPCLSATAVPSPSSPGLCSTRLSIPRLPKHSLPHRSQTSQCIPIQVSVFQPTAA